MNLTPTELERLTIFAAAQLAREHMKRYIKFSHPSVATTIWAFGDAPWHGTQIPAHRFM